MTAPARALIIDENATTARAAAAALLALGAQVALQPRPGSEGFLDLDRSPWGEGEPDLVLLNVTRYQRHDWDSLRALLDLSTGQTPVVPMSLRSASIPPDLIEHPKVAPCLQRPATPRQLCFAAFMAQPRLRPPNGEPPFPRLLRPDDAAVDISFDGPASLGPHEAAPDDHTVAMPTLERLPAPRAGRFRDDDWELADEGTNVDLSPVLLGSVFDNDDDNPLEPGVTSLDSMDIEAEAPADQEDRWQDLRPILPGQITLPGPMSEEVDLMTSQDLEILEVEELDLDPEPSPPWLELLEGLWPALLRAPDAAARARLLAASLSAAGLDLGAWWASPEVAADVARELDQLQHARALCADLDALPTLEALRLIRARDLCCALTLRADDHRWHLDLDGDRLLHIHMTPPLLAAGPPDPAALLALAVSAHRGQLSIHLRQPTANAQDLGSVSLHLLDLMRAGRLGPPPLALREETLLVRDNLALHQIGDAALEDRELSILRVAQFGRTLAEVRAALEAAGAPTDDLEALALRLKAVGLLELR